MTDGKANIEVPNVRTRTVPVYLANFIFAQCVARYSLCARPR
jgi:hypothetical protein